MPIADICAGVPALLSWFAENGRPLPWRLDATPYHVWISEVMLQQTRIEAVIPHYEAFIRLMPDLTALAEMPEERLLKCWEGLGYYSRARNLQKAAKAVVASGESALPQTYAELIRLPGIGEYTAGAIASIAFGECVPAVDGNVLRVLSRLLNDDTDVLSPAGKKHFTAVARALVPQTAGQFNQAIMELGETVCLPHAAPRCTVCPLAAVCRGKRAGTAADLPVRKKPRARRVEQKTVFLLLSEKEDAVLLHKRPQSGLLAGLYEFPNADGALTAEETLELLNEQGFTVYEMEKTAPAKHLFTHIEWQMSGFMARVCARDVSADCVWAGTEELMGRFALPSAFKSFLKILQKHLT